MKKQLATTLVLAAFASGLFAPGLASAAPRAAAVPTPVPSPQLPAVPTVAAGYAAPDLAPNSPDLVGITAQPFVGITLQDAIGMALLKNPDLAIAASNVRIAGYQIVAATGAFDTQFMLEPSVTHVTEAPQNAFFAGPNFGAIVQNTQKLQAGVSGQLPAGTQYSAGLSSAKTDDNTLINSFDPYYPSTLQLQLTQPLLRDKGENPAKHQLELASINADVSQATALTGVSQTLSQVSDAYWDLVAAWRNVAIQEEALREAVAQQGSAVRLAKQGAAANVDAVESSSQVASFQGDVYSSLQTVALLQNELKGLIVNDPADPIWRANLVPTSSVLQLPSEPSLDQLVATAMNQRPEVRQVADAQRQAALNLKFAKNQALPKVDLQLGYSSNGFAGQPTNSSALSSFGPAPTIPPYLIGNGTQSLSNTFDNRFPTYNVGVLFSAPIGNHTGKADVAIAQQQQQIAAIQGNGLAARIQAEARNALQGYQSALALLHSARIARQASEQVFASESRKFHNGESTTFLVLQRQVELAQNRGRELQAQTNLNKAVVELQRVSGDILTANNVNLSTLGSQATK
jgi:HAE1 family hydrophobic/amphiphilic exporter-1